MSPRGKHTIVAATLTMGTIIGGMGTARTTGLAHAMAPRIPANIIVSRDAYPAHGMPALAVDPRDRRAVIGVAKLFTRDGATLPFTFASVDGGVSWRDDGPLPLPSGYTFGSADATAAFTPRGTGLVAATAWGPTSGASSSGAPRMEGGPSPHPLPSGAYPSPCAATPSRAVCCPTNHTSPST